MSIFLHRAGLLTTVQDLGRVGYQKYGVIVGGVMDHISAKTANLLLHNEINAPLLEVTLFGPVLEFKKDCWIAICGGEVEAKVNGESISAWRPIWVDKGVKLSIDAISNGCRAYIAFSRRLVIQSVMGSISTNMQAGLGGLHGRALEKGDEIFFDEDANASDDTSDASNEMVMQHPSASHHDVNRTECKKRRTYDACKWQVRPPISFSTSVLSIRCIRGTEFAQFDKQSQLHFFSKTYTISAQSDRMGLRLQGEALRVDDKQEMISDVVAFGTVQVPPDGHPIILMADHQTTGGYPRMAQVILADLPLLAQAAPHTVVKFKEVTLAEAEKLLMQQEKNMKQIKLAIQMKGMQHHAY
ncbi:biotin-dependent carboxyltransferase family protein [Longirhabdus pacifica]|uniref:5-oxoprolinase subunit C family protein n=1 Tax=Longirhabdus pacifica TaxID=2305227 RepID=UPI001008A349|nr:biotin-dependent carboxyltransferase family protein [Longirhabdus pacifica]